MSFQPAPIQTPVVDAGGIVKSPVWVLWLQKVAQALAYGNTATTAGNTGAAALPATPEGFVIMNINGEDKKIPYYPM